MHSAKIHIVFTLVSDTTPKAAGMFEFFALLSAESTIEYQHLSLRSFEASVSIHVRIEVLVLKRRSNMASSVHAIDAYLFSITGLLGLIANAIQIALLRRDENQKKSTFAIALLSLNIADLLASILYMFRGGISIMAVLGAASLALLEEWKKPMMSALLFSLTSSFTHLIFIAIQRVLAVTFPLKIKVILTKSKSFLILAALWAFSLTPALTNYFHPKIFGTVPYITILTAVTLLITYSIICYKARKQNSLNNMNEAMRRRRQQTDKEVLVYSIAVTTVFIVCNLPKTISMFLHPPVYLMAVCDVLYTSNPFIDPLLYFAWSFLKRKRRAVVDHALAAAISFSDIK